MKNISEELEVGTFPVHPMEAKKGEAVATAKYIAIWKRCAFYELDKDKDGRMFGLLIAARGSVQYAYSTVKALEWFFDLPYNSKVERDTTFKPTKLKDLKVRAVIDFLAYMDGETIFE